MKASDAEAKGYKVKLIKKALPEPKKVAESIKPEVITIVNDNKLVTEIMASIEGNNQVMLEAIKSIPESNRKRIISADLEYQYDQSGLPMVKKINFSWEK